jgi:hypothetical protein
MVAVQRSSDVQMVFMHCELKEELSMLKLGKSYHLRRL